MKGEVLILIPVYKENISVLESASLKQLLEVTGGKYPVRFIAPAGLPVKNYLDLVHDHSDVEFSFFKPFYFKGLTGYNRLLMNPELYNRFIDWEYVLIYHLDAFIFSDQIAHWCSMGYDNIGAPIYEYDHTSDPKNYLGIGNGGFCLRKTASCLRVLKSFKVVYPFQEITADFLNYSFKGKIARAFYYLDMFSTLGSRANFRMNRIKLNEDIFWGKLVPAAFDWYRVPDCLTAARFSLEYNSAELFMKNNKVLPFGCHGWDKPLLRDFWRPHFLKYGITL